MSRSNHSLKIYDSKANKTYPISLYTRKEECNTDNNWLPLLIDNQILFMPITPYLGNEATGGSTAVRTLKNNKTYQILQNGEFYLKIQQSPNQTITLHVGGQSWTDENEHWFPYGTQWIATIVGHDGYNPGALNVSSGTLTDNNVTVTAAGATFAYVSCTLFITIKSGTLVGTDFNPKNINGVSFDRITTARHANSLDFLVTNGARRHAQVLIGDTALDMIFPDDGHWRTRFNNDIYSYLKAYNNQRAPIQIIVY